MESHLLQMRGLKLIYINIRIRQQYVASFTDAWIETFRICRALVADAVASFTDAWIETRRFCSLFVKSILSRIFYRCVD